MKRASDLGTSPTRAFAVRFAIHVQPGARVPKVGGTKAGSLSVRVRERAVEGAANEAVIEAVARALAVKPRAIRIVHGSQRPPCASSPRPAIVARPKTSSMARFITAGATSPAATARVGPTR